MTRAEKPRRKGIVIVLSAAMMIVLFGMVAFAVDVGYIVNARTELQRTADACAMAAAMRLPDTSEAVTVATDVADENLGMVGPPLASSDVEFGVWDRDTATFTTPTPAYRSPGAVRVTLMRADERGNPLSLFVASLLNTSTADASATAIAMVDRDLCGPFVGIDWVSVPGSPQTDSFNSWEGSYVPGHGKHRGSLCSDGPIDIEGSPRVRGDARAGKGHNVTLEGNASISGNIGSRLKPLNMPPVDATEAAVDNNNGNIPMIPEGNGWRSVVDSDNNFLLDGSKTLDLPGGTYYFNNFELAGQATLNVMGPVKLYVTGDFRRAGGVNVNINTQRANAFQVYMTGGTANITSNNDFYGVIYGPNTDVTVDGDSDMFGAIVGKTLTITGSGFAHYDEALELDGVNLPMRSALVE